MHLTITLYCYWWKRGPVTESQGKHSRDPLWDIVAWLYFIVEAKLKDGPWVPSVSSPSALLWKKVYLCLRPRNRVIVQTFCAIGSAPVFPAALCWHRARPTQSLQSPQSSEGYLAGTEECTSKQGQHVLLRESLFVKLGFYWILSWTWEGPSALQTNQSFTGWYWILPLTNEFPRSSRILCPLSSAIRFPG